MKYYIGIDIGTSSVKLTCIDENAKVAGESSREYKIEEPKSGWKEIDPEKWIKGMEEAFAELFETIHKYTEQSRTAPSKALPDSQEMPVLLFHCASESGREWRPEFPLQRF